MDINILNFYFQQIGFKKKQNKKFLNYIRKNYEVKIFAIDKKAFILKDDLILFETGLPTNEASIVKWCNLLIQKDEKETT
jgi:hypothetical protein